MFLLASTTCSMKFDWSTSMVREGLLEGKRASVMVGNLCQLAVESVTIAPVKIVSTGHGGKGGRTFKKGK
ncbi:hypothetical protein SACS_0509 [Parasaccharibacter apium]|uniref:Uncharacterized protein n=1 Tax=Parasaccharibacter apium TaxID=1510841 RepID=A0A7U7J0N9_9PROT|nr:hypothetical protein SACS_0509 [Parasaccharibacter apium]